MTLVRRIHVFITDDCYELTIRGSHILSITKYSGSTQTPRDLLWDELPESVQHYLSDAITIPDENEEEN